MTTPKHDSVLLDQVVNAIAPHDGMHIIDATLGSGGHALALLTQVLPGGMVLGIERDPDIFAHAPKADGLVVVNGSYEDLEALAAVHLLGTVDAVLFDFGMHSYHVDASTRGMSFRRTAPLDMRFSQDPNIPTARDVLNGADRQELLDALRAYGEEPHAERIASAICKERRTAPLQTTDDLVRIVLESIPNAKASARIHPATKTFQAIRMLVNDEEHVMEEGLRAACRVVKPGGKVLAIGFHRVDHVVSKKVFKAMTDDGLGITLTKHAIKPYRSEVLRNRRSRSAQLRIWQKAN